MKAGILGPRGTYAEDAARANYGDDAEIVPYPLITEVAETVAKGEVDTGVVPAESLREGSVGETLDALVNLDVQIPAEIVIKISHCLLGVPGTNIEEVKQVLSHPQALAQCRDYLRTNLQRAELVEVASTAKAAEQVRGKGKTSMVAIGSKALADAHGLEVLDEEIQTAEENVTRFICLAKSDSAPTGDDKTSIVFSSREDRSGILYEILKEFADRRINLTKIESRPSKKALGDYLFFIDLEGHREDAKIKEALDALKPNLGMMKVLGSYPKRF